MKGCNRRTFGILLIQYPNYLTVAYSQKERGFFFCYHQKTSKFWLPLTLPFVGSNPMCCRGAIEISETTITQTTTSEWDDRP